MVQEQDKDKDKGQDNKDKRKELSENAKENLRRNEELRSKASPFLTLQAGDKFLALFNAEKIEPVKQEFEGKMVQKFQYTVMDPNTGQENDAVRFYFKKKNKEGKLYVSA